MMFNTDTVSEALGRLQKLMAQPDYAKFRSNKRVWLALFAKILNDMDNRTR